ncbi:PHP domain-containing protein [Arcanobacterium hippocoleae]
MRIDLHTHSLVSDGTDSPAQLVQKAKAAGLDAVAITDHDTIGGWEEAASAAVSARIALVRGMETTTSYCGVIVHLLAYLFNPEHPKLLEHFFRMRHGRNERVKEMALRVAQDYPINLERIMENAGANGTLGRPHIADELVRIGAAKTVLQRLRKLLHLDQNTMCATNLRICLI